MRDGRVTAAALAGVILLGCAREMPPPGTRPDEVPPSILRIRPAPDSVVVDFAGRLELRFDEPVRIPNNIARQMFVSPMEVYEVETGFSSLRLRPEDGWRDSVTYCYSIPADEIADLLRNRMEGKAEFCFFSGAALPEAPISGSIVDGLTGQPQTEARVIFWSGPDSVPYGAVTDSVGAFAARGIPPGEYEAFGFVDRNRNLLPDRELENYDSVRVTARSDSLLEVHFVVLPPDTTPPLLARAVLAGGDIVQLEFDDYLLNPQPGDPVITIRDSSAARDIEIEEFLVGSADAVTFASDSAAAADSAAAGDAAAAPDSAAAADSAAAPDPAEVDPPDTDSAAAAADTAEEALVLPSRFITVKLAEALDSVTYLVSVSEVLNVRHLLGGGDTSFVAEPPVTPEDPAQAVADAAGAVADTAGAAADTAGAAADTAGTAADTIPASAGAAQAPPDTAGAPPDTLGTPPDTLRGGRVARRRAWRRG